jgi:SAM-dependent methyltransferase
MTLKKNIIANYFGQFYVLIISIVMVPFYLKYLGAEAYKIAKSKIDELHKQFESVDFKVGTSGNLPFKSNSFDYVAAINSVYYLDANDTLEKNIATCANVLKSGGIVLHGI